MPAFAPPGRGALGLAEALGHWRHAWSVSGVGLPGKHVLHHGRWDRGHAPAAGIPRTVGLKESAGGRSGPWQPLAPASLGLASPAHALGNQGPLGLGHGSTDVSQPLSMRLITHRPRDTLDATALLGACIDPEQLMDRVARSTSRGGDEHPSQGGPGRPVAESIKTGTREGGATRAVIPGDVLVGPIPLGGRRTVLG